jgi:hypothetical protein
MPKNAPKKPDQHKEKPLFLRLPAPYQKALRDLANASRRTLTAQAMIALEEHFAKNGVKLSGEGGKSSTNED